MKLSISNILVPALTAVFTLASCSDWTDAESLDIHTPSIQEQNSELYAKYVQSLNAYKASEHQVVIASVDNLSTTPSARNQHLTNLPDSIDYICLNNVTDVNDVNIDEITEVRKLGTKVLGLIDFDAIEKQWEILLDEEANNSETGDDEEIGNTDAGDEPTDSEVYRFIAYSQNEVTTLLNACDKLDLDGLVINYTGADLNILVDEEEIDAEIARQGAFFDTVASWKANNAKTLLFKGYPQNVISKAILSDCLYIIVDAHSAKNDGEMSYRILMASVNNVPTDRFVIGVTTPYITSTGSWNGELGDGSSAIIGAARWAVATTSEYVKAGISIDSAEQDYFNVSLIYPNIRGAITILNPTAK